MSSRALPVVLAPVLLAAALGACSAPAVDAPSLARRPAEAIDPRLPVGGETPARGPADRTLANRLGTLVGEAHAGDRAFEQAAGEAERLAATAGGPQSESWVVAQQALSQAVAARAPTTRAMGEIDAMTAQSLAERQWIAPGNLAAIEAATREASAIDERQAARIKAIAARLGR